MSGSRDIKQDERALTDFGLLRQDGDGAAAVQEDWGQSFTLDATLSVHAATAQADISADRSKATAEPAPM